MRILTSGKSFSSTPPVFPWYLSIGIVYEHRHVFEEIQDIIFEGRELDILLSWIQTLEQLDPDFLIIPNEDKFALNYLAHRAARNALTDEFHLGRLPVPVYPKKQGEG